MLKINFPWEVVAECGEAFGVLLFLPGITLPSPSYMALIITDISSAVLLFSGEKLGTVHTCRSTIHFLTWAFSKAKLGQSTCEYTENRYA